MNLHYFIEHLVWRCACYFVSVAVGCGTAYLCALHIQSMRLAVSQVSSLRF